jgi:sulfur carrier protein ThiS
MKIEVQLHTTLRRQTPEGILDNLVVELPEGSLLADLLDHLDLGLDPDSILLVLNGRTAALDQELSNGDVVNLMTAISGG